jgi:hypothetical protein
LRCGVTSLEKRGVVDGVAFLYSNPAVPLASHACELRIERRSKIAKEAGKRVFEVAILALAEAVPRHLDLTSEVALVRIERCNRAAFLGREKLWQDGATVVASLPASVCQP